MPRVAIVLTGMIMGLALLGACAGSTLGPAGSTPFARQEITETVTPAFPTATPRPTLTPTLTPSPTRTPLAGPPTAREDANLRAGPGVGFPKMGSVQAGDILQLVAANSSRDWVQLIQGPWILADLVANIPDLPAVQVPSVSPTRGSPTAASAATPAPP